MENAACSNINGGKWYASFGPSGWSEGVDCLPISSDSLSSVTVKPWSSEILGVNNTLGLLYTSPVEGNPSLHVGLICDEEDTDNNNVIEGPLTWSLADNTFSTWNKSHKNCSVYQNSALI